MAEMQVRAARSGDGDAMAAAWIDAGAYYEALDSDAFQTPSAEGLAADLERELAEARPADVAWLVAELDGEVTGYVYAQVIRPGPDAVWQLIRDASTARLHVDALVVAARSRRGGAGRALMGAVEEWARARGATAATLETYAQSALSVPFYEALGYRRHNIGFRKRLDQRGSV